MPRYSVVRFVPIPEGEFDAQFRRNIAKELAGAGILPERFKNVICHGNYSNGNYIIYDPSTEPATPLLLLRKIASLPGEKDE